MDFRKRVGEERFSDVAFADLQSDPVNTLRETYESLDLVFSDAAAGSVEQWAAEHKPGARGAHDYELADFGLTPAGVRERFREYLDTYDATA
jgi:hypothetical protein